MKKLHHVLVTTVTLIMALVFFCASASATTWCVTDGVRVRAEPNGKIIGRLTYGQEVNVIKSEGGWSKIKFGEGTGFVYSSYLKDGQKYKSNVIGLTKKSTKMLTSLSSRNTITIPKNEVILVTGIADELCSVVYNGKKGYVMASSIEKKDLKQRKCIGCFTVTFYQNDGIRKSNMKKAVQKLNGKQIKAGETFSFLNAVGKNFEEASEFMEDDTSIGGGLIHVATCLKKALNSAQSNGCNIRFREINSCGRKTPYARKGDEAFVNIKMRKDLRFTNNNKYPFRINGLIRGDSVIFVITY